MSGALVKFEAACRAVAECKAVDEVKGIHDKAEAMRVYARLAGDKSMEIDAAEIRIRAERRLGEMLAEQKAAGGLSRGAADMVGNQHTGKSVRSSIATAPTLADAGITKDLSSRAQKLAAVPPAEFEAEVGEWRDRVHAEGARVTTRLEEAGERAIKASRTPARDEQAAQLAADAHGDFDPLAELEAAQREIARLLAEIAAVEADDAKAAVLKWQRIAHNAEGQQRDAMDSASKAAGRERWIVGLLRQCGRAVGEKDLDPETIVAAVKAFARQHREASA